MRFISCLKVSAMAALGINASDLPGGSLASGTSLGFLSEDSHSNLRELSTPTTINCANPVSTTRSWITMSTSEIKAYEAYTISVQLYGTDGAARTAGGEAPSLEI